jgi:hypothetical protein
MKKPPLKIIINRVQVPEDPNRLNNIFKVMAYCGHWPKKTEKRAVVAR